MTTSLILALIGAGLLIVWLITVVINWVKKSRPVVLNSQEWRVKRAAFMWHKR